MTLLRIIAAIVASCFFFVGTWKMLGAMQQSGYKGKAFYRWIKDKDNTLMGRLAVWATLLFLGAGLTALCFAFLSLEVALCLTALPFYGLSLLYALVDKKFALKVPVKRTGRLTRLAAVYFFLTLCFTYAVIALCAFFGDWVATSSPNSFYLFLQYLPVAVMPVLLPFVLLLANAVASIF